MRITVIPGDGIGPEIIAQAVKVIQTTERLFPVHFELLYRLAGGAALDEYGCALPDDTLITAQNSNAVLLGAVGGPKWDGVPADERPEKALLKLRKGLQLYGNLRPVLLPAALSDRSPLRQDLVENGLDLLIVRELTGGIYFGQRGSETNDGGEQAWDTECYSSQEIERITKLAFELARKRSARVTSVDKANVLASSQLWRRVVNRVANQYPDVSLEHMYVDNCAMQLIRCPKQFDVIVTSNMFGDILSDEASVLAGSIGMLPSASLGAGTLGMYEPAHGSAPDIAGTGKANPLATILSVAMMFRYSLALPQAADAVEQAVQAVLAQGYCTADMISENSKLLTTEQMGDQIVYSMMHK